MKTNLQRIGYVASFFFACFICYSGKSPDTGFDKFKKEFIAGYAGLDIPGIEYDHREYFRLIPAVPLLEQQLSFFKTQRRLLNRIDSKQLSAGEQEEYHHLAYEIDFNLQRLALEHQWVSNGRKMPEGGIHTLQNRREWYMYFIRKFTSTNITPEQVFALGQQEVKRVQAEIGRIKDALGFKDSIAFYSHLQHDSFYLRDKNAVIERFTQIDSTVRVHLHHLLPAPDVPPVHAMEWPGAGQYTPPGIYLGHGQNAYGKDVFQFNFWDGRYNKRAMEWLYMHEAIPGHHLQSSLAPRSALDSLFIYPGNFEGWACYVEYLGAELGLYTDPYSYLGKWEWDLVRSARLVLDAGIHYYGWTQQQALDYWNTTIPGQDDIAQREITRVTNWCGQALSYKVGAGFIMQLKEGYMQQKNTDARAFHQFFIRSGRVPLEVLKATMAA